MPYTAVSNTVFGKISGCDIRITIAKKRAVCYNDHRKRGGKMRIIHNKSTDPYFNLATEEYLIDNADEDIFMLWRNDRAVIIGRNQNTYAEINENFCRENGVKVVRRLTGGGAVFHDLGNVNYTFITNAEEAQALDFARFCKPIIDALGLFGVKAELSGRNDITAEGRKVSGTAQCVRNGRLMHHGCILYSADLSSVEGALKVNEEKMRSKGIKSVRSRVANLADLIYNAPDVEGFIDFIESHTDGIRRDLGEDEINAISKLTKVKYSTWEWNFGKSKNFSKTSTKRFPYGTVTVSYTLDAGVITEIVFEGDYFGTGDASELSKLLAGRRFGREMTDGVDFGKYIAGMTAEDAAALLTE